MRIVSLLPSATEVVCELGLMDQLVGVSADCDWPAAVRGKPVLAESIVTEDPSNAALEQGVHSGVHHGQSVFHLEPAQLRALAPDLVLSRESCQLCAPAFSEVRGAAKLWEQVPRLVSLEPRTLDDVLDNVDLIGRLTGRQGRARRLAERLAARCEGVRRRAEVAEELPRVLCLDWLDPPFAAGQWVPQLVERAGGQTLGEVGEPSFELGLADLERFNPEVVVLMPCGADPQRTARELEVLTECEAWSELSAVKRGRVYLVQGATYFSRPGPRLVVGLELLAKALHPELFRGLVLPPGALYRLEGP